MVIMSIDGSTKASGVAIFEDEKLIHSEVIYATNTDLYKRIKKEIAGIMEIANKYKPNEVYMEEILPEDVRNNQTTFKALMYLQAFLMMEFHDRGIKPELIVASSWRKLVGIHTGRGIRRETLKAKAIELIQTHYNRTVTDDEADAICIGHAMINRKIQSEPEIIDGFEFK